MNLFTWFLTNVFVPSYQAQFDDYFYFATNMNDQWEIWSQCETYRWFHAHNPGVGGGATLQREWRYGNGTQQSADFMVTAHAEVDAFVEYKVLHIGGNPQNSLRNRFNDDINKINNLPGAITRAVAMAHAPRDGRRFLNTYYNSVLAAQRANYSYVLFTDNGIQEQNTLDNYNAAAGLDNDTHRASLVYRIVRWA